MNYYFISFWLYDKDWNNGIPMPPALVKAVSIQEAWDKLRDKYSHLNVGTFENLTIE